MSWLLGGSNICQFLGFSVFCLCVEIVTGCVTYMAQKTLPFLTGSYLILLSILIWFSFKTAKRAAQLILLLFAFMKALKVAMLSM